MRDAASHRTGRSRFLVYALVGAVVGAAAIAAGIERVYAVAGFDNAIEREARPVQLANVPLSDALPAAIDAGFVARRGGEAAAPAVPHGIQRSANGRAVSINLAQAQATIRGLIFVPEQAQAQRPVTEMTGEVDTGAVPFLSSSRFTDLARKAIGKPVSIEALQEVVNDTVLYSRSVNYPVVDVFVPEQEIRNGIVRVVVLVSRLGKVRVEGNRWFSSNQIRNKLTLQPGQEIRSDTLQVDLAAINSNPFMSVDAVFDRGEAAGTTDVVLRVTDRFPVRVYGAYANDGTRATDRRRVSTGFNWGDAFMLGHRLDYQFSRSVSGHLFKSHSGTYSIPLPWRDTFSVSASYSETNSPLASSFNSKGFGRQYQARYDMPLPDFNIADGYSHALGIGAQYKKFNNNLLFGGTTVFDNAPELWQGFASYSASLRDAWGSTTFVGDGFFGGSPFADGGLPCDYDVTGAGICEANGKFNAARAGATAHYVYGRIRVERLFRLPYDFSLVARGVAQWTNRNLLGSEQLAVGGYNSVRGYDEDTYLGDKGYLGTAELRLPPFELLPLLGFKGAQDQMQFLAFFDYGVAKPYSRPIGSTVETRVAKSAGTGFRYAFNPFFTARFDLARTLRPDETPGRDGNATRVHFGVVAGY